MKTILRSNELSCPSCVAKIEKQLRSLDGVSDAVVHFNTGKIEVEHDEETAGPQSLVETVRAAGYDSRVSTI